MYITTFRPCLALSIPDVEGFHYLYKFEWPSMRELYFEGKPKIPLLCLILIAASFTRLILHSIANPNSTVAIWIACCFSNSSERAATLRIVVAFTLPVSSQTHKLYFLYIYIFLLCSIFLCVLFSVLKRSHFVRWHVAYFVFIILLELLWTNIQYINRLRKVNHV
jgi:hypothetical protein